MDDIANTRPGAPAGEAAGHPPRVQDLPGARGPQNHRAHTLAPPTTLRGRVARAVSDGIEHAVVRASVHGDPMVYDPALFPWTGALRGHWRAIRDELDRVLEHREQLPNFQDILKEVGTITRDDRWKTFWLAGIGMDCSDNRARCPQTVRALAGIPGLQNAFFSILAPGKHIPAHRGAYNGILRLHLALKVPQPAGDCRLRVGDRMLHWREGEALIFDDSFQHEVWNDTPGERVVLFVDFARPLKQPWHWLNRRLMQAAAVAPFLREADQRHRRWMRQFRGAAPRTPG